MSHSTAAFRFEDGTILHGEYNGTVDVMLPFMYITKEERESNWRRVDWKYCFNPTEHKHERVEIATTYGGGFEWVGTACRECMVVIGPLLDFYNSQYSDKLPEWYPTDKD